MTDDMMGVRTLLEKSPDADFLREMIGFAARDQVEAFLSGRMLSPSLFALADHLAALAMIDGDGRRLNRLPSKIRAVWPREVRSLMLRYARDFKPRLAMLEPVD